MDNTISRNSIWAALTGLSVIALWCLGTPWLVIGQTSAAAPRADVELRIWRAAANAAESGPVEQYLRRYPKGRFAEAARERLTIILIHQVGPICEKGNPQEGVSILSASISFLPMQAQVFRMRAVCRAKMGETADAIKDLTLALRIAPNDPDLYYSRGTFNLNSGNVAEAFEDLSEAIRLRRDHEPSWGNRCSAALRLMRSQQAVDDCTEALRLAPSDPIDLQNRALAYFGLQKYELSLADADASAKQSSERGDAFALRAVLRFNMGQKDRAIDDLNASLQKPVRPGLLIMRAGVLKQLGRTNEALNDLDSACRMEPGLKLARVERARLRIGQAEFKAALEDLDAAVQLDSKDPELRYLRATVRGTLGDVGGHRSDLDAGIQMDRASATGLKMRATLLKDSRRYQDALADLDEAIRRSPQDAETYALRGFVRNALGQVPDGEADFAKAISIDPKLPGVYLLQADVYKSNSIDKALSAYNRALAVDSTNAQAKVQRGAFFLQLGRYDEALHDFDDIRQEKMWQPIADSFSSTVFFKTGRYAEAIEAADRSITAKPIGLTAFSAYYARGTVYKEINQCDLAVADFTHALEFALDNIAALKDRAACYVMLKNTDLAMNDVRRVLEKYPNDAGAIMLRGHAQWARNDIELALTDFSRAAELDPNNYFTHYNRASALGQLKRPSEGIPVAGRTIELNPRDPRGFRLRATLYQDLGQYGNALHDYIDAFRLENSVEALQLVGQLYERQGQIPESLEQFAKDFKLNVMSVTPRIIRARLYLSRNNYAAAVKDLNEIIRTNPKLSYAYQLRADAESGLGDGAAYERDLRKVIELEPQNHSALNNLAYALVSAPDRLSEARGLILQAMRYAPDNVDYLDTRGWIEYLLGNVTDAELYLRQAAMGTGSDTIHDHLAQVLMHNGDSNGAREHWRIAVQSLESQTPIDSKRVAELKKAVDEAAKESTSSRAIAVLGVVKVRCDIDCVVAIDERDTRRARSGSVTRIAEFLGKHRAFAISMDGLDTWTGEVNLTAADSIVEIPLKSARAGRQDREKTLITLKTNLPTLKTTLEGAKQELSGAQAEAAKATQNSPLTKRRRADELRDRLVTYIESLERALSWETAEAARLESAAQQADSAGDSSTAGQVVGLIGKLASAKEQHSAEIHRERKERVLNRIDGLTNELGKLANSDDVPESRIPVPPSRFAIARKEGTKWIMGEATISSGDLHWKSDSGSVQYQCSELKSGKRGKEAEFSVEYGKTKVGFKAAGPDARDQLIEVWYIGCPQRVAW